MTIISEFIRNVLHLPRFTIKSMNNNTAALFNSNNSAMKGTAATLSIMASGLSITSFITSHDSENGDNDTSDTVLENVSNESSTVVSTVSPLLHVPLLQVPFHIFNHDLIIQSCSCEAPSSNSRNSNKLGLEVGLNLKLPLPLKSVASLHSTYDVSFRRRPLGKGSFGEVYGASTKYHSSQSSVSSNNKMDNFDVAIKRMPKSLTDMQTFQKEINALLEIKNRGGHPNICALRDVYADHQYYYVVLDLVTGGEMFDHLIRRGAYSEADAARLLREVAGALSFLHGIGVVHGDLKPENLMLTSNRSSDAVLQVVDFGCAEIRSKFHDESTDNTTTSSSSSPPQKKQMAWKTPAYSPPESLNDNGEPLLESVDMWSLGVILYIMLTGVHPFDLSGTASEEEIERRIKLKKVPQLKNAPVTSHLSPSAINVIERLLQWDPEQRITALQLLSHPWVTGRTAKESVIAGSDRRLRKYKPIQSKMEARVFKSFLAWSDGDDTNNNTDEKTNNAANNNNNTNSSNSNNTYNNNNITNDKGTRKRASLIEKAFRSFDSGSKGYLTGDDFRHLTKSSSSDKATDDRVESPTSHEDLEVDLSLSGFSDLLSENMKNRYFPAGQTVYHEGEFGNKMYFIDSGTVEVTTEDGSHARRTNGDFFGEGVHAIEISREYFEKYLSSSEAGILSLDMKEKDKTRKRNRAKTILRLQKNLKELHVDKDKYLFKAGEDAAELYILEAGRAEVLVGGKKVFAVKPGDICGEHSLIMGRPRNTSAICVSNGGCVVQEMGRNDFHQIYGSSQSIRESLREICFRREFQKALVQHTGKDFPSVDDLRGVFDVADTDGSGFLNVSESRALLKSFDPSLSEKEIMEVMRSLDLDCSGLISFDEFKTIFGMKESRASSM